MIKEVIKRDGSLEKYSRIKIYGALMSAAKNTKEVLYPEVLDTINTIEQKINNLKQEIVSIEVIQDIIERQLMISKYKETAKAYIRYRHERNMIRESKSDLIKTIESFIDQTDKDILTENANKASSTVTTHRDLLAGLLSKHYSVNHLFNKDVAEAHNQGFIHCHDADYYISPLTNCLLVNYRNMLEKGFRIGDAKIETPNSIGVATTILTQISQSVASSVYGGQTSAHIDSGLAPYVKKSHDKLKVLAKRYNLGNDFVEEMLEKEVYDAMQTFLYQINSLTTTNGQTPFITISFGLDTSKYGRMITKAYLQNHIKGVGEDGITPVFPKVIFFLEDGINLKPTDPNYDLKKLAIECSTKRIYPDYISVPLNKQITSAKETAVTSMGCRSFLSNYVENGKEKFDGRFNLGVVTLNLPMIAKLSLTTNESFDTVLNKYLDIAYKAHMDRVDRLKGTKAKQNPTLFVNGAIARLHPEETIDKLFYNGYASISIGFIGLAETCELLTGKLDKDFALSIINKMKLKVEQFKQESNIGFSLYGTPSESYCKRAVDKYNEYFDESWDRKFFTNSFHIPVWNECSPFDKWNYEQGFAELVTGGHIGYIEQPSLINNLTAYESFIDYAYNVIPYYGINTPVDKCFKCGFNGEFEVSEDGYKCPDCGNNEKHTICVTRRVSGYLSNPDDRPFNEGKQSECMERVKHK